jgi:transposase-like protein
VVFDGFFMERLNLLDFVNEVGGDVEGLMKEIALTNNYFLSENKTIDYINKKYGLEEKTLSSWGVRQAKEGYLIDLEGYDGLDKVNEYNSRKSLTFCDDDSDLVERLKGDVAVRDTRKLTLDEKYQIYEMNKNEGIRAEDIAKQFNLKSKHSVYSVNKFIKNKIVKESEHLFGVSKEEVFQEEYVPEPISPPSSVDAIFEISSEDLSSLF